MPKRRLNPAAWEKETKAEARYHPADHFCGRCVFYQPDGKDYGECTKVRGVIEYDAGCELFRPAGADR